MQNGDSLGGGRGTSAAHSRFSLPSAGQAMGNPRAGGGILATRRYRRGVSPMRILLVDTFYEGFVEAFYAQHPGLAEESYDLQWRSVMGTFFANADAYSHYLREAGHEAHELVVDCDPLQQAWAREHGIRPPLVRRGRRARLERVVEAQVENFRPDVLYVQNLGVLRPGLLRRVGRHMLVAGQIASESPSERQQRAFDLIVTSFPHYVERFRALGIASEYLKLGFDPRVLHHIAQQERDLDLVFVGALGRAQHARGNALLERVAERLPLQVWGRAIEQQPERSPLRRAYRGSAWGLEMMRLYARARIALNRHIDVAEGYANNMRLYEATGMGALVFTEDAPNLGELFEPGREVIAYRGVDDLVERAEHYLSCEEEWRAVAEAGQRRTLSEHTYATRMEELAAILERHAG
jgi:spore maturation protein CgeB